MKNRGTKILAFAMFIAGTSFGLAQDTAKQIEKKNIKVQKHTVMEKFEPELVISVEDRIQLKQERIVQLKETKELLDTLSISKRKKRKLMRDLRRSPIFSDRLNKVIAENKFEENEN